MTITKLMKASVVALIVGCIGLHSASANDRLSIGLGVGAPFAGIGGNIAMANNQTLKYLAFGCMAHYESSDGHSGNACGIGIEWITTDISTSHGLGLHAGPVSARRPTADSIDTVYAIGATHVYYRNGVGRPGFQWGITPALGRENGALNGYVLLNFGYQFFWKEITDIWLWMSHVSANHLGLKFQLDNR